jgi:hypothetical protein
LFYLNQTKDKLESEIEDIGLFGIGAYTQSGGEHKVEGLSIASGSGSIGTYNLSGSGTLPSTSELIGHQSTGTFNQSGGTNSTISLV